MEPVFSEFDRVLTFNYGKIQKGSVIVFEEAGESLIKRVKTLSRDNVVAESDNKAKAKRVYKIKRADVVGRVFLKY